MRLIDYGIATAYLYGDFTMVGIMLAVIASALTKYTGWPFLPSLAPLVMPLTLAYMIAPLDTFTHISCFSVFRRAPSSLREIQSATIARTILPLIITHWTFFWYFSTKWTTIIPSVINAHHTNLIMYVSSAIAVFGIWDILRYASVLPTYVTLGLVMSHFHILVRVYAVDTHTVALSKSLDFAVMVLLAAPILNWFRILCTKINSSILGATEDGLPYVFILMCVARYRSPMYTNLSWKVNMLRIGVTVSLLAIPVYLNLSAVKIVLGFIRYYVSSVLVEWM